MLLPVLLSNYCKCTVTELINLSLTDVDMLNYISIGKTEFLITVLGDNVHLDKLFYLSRQCMFFGLLILLQIQLSIFGYLLGLCPVEV